ncbi:WD repeat and FYVE domain-containing protein 3-like [Trypanosoma rangeli]|uniref:WD repeat and FYVE domain-containing protein 3-like n=1 Tax=Trypanosoma rangeli TaxID=5698 RepID=A0A3R7MDY9_TRYRA|nr:WD repeat and FYVE domain-containing protein 3-like [Trypanosoma rangeli]RNF00801.1 WD repeat and FYVE domain-containing protein 3-like [Trypanosoma rangeli]|eukprot:RNF00801.1 WD repeat and FYVE domain-containing protein 3-like [Trypanosoma rangeli]
MNTTRHLISCAEYVPALLTTVSHSEALLAVAGTLELTIARYFEGGVELLAVAWSMLELMMQAGVTNSSSFSKDDTQDVEEVISQCGPVLRASFLLPSGKTGCMAGESC